MSHRSLTDNVIRYVWRLRDSKWRGSVTLAIAFLLAVNFIQPASTMAQDTTFDSQVLGFEILSGWATSAGTLSLSSTHVEGSESLAISGISSGTAHIQSAKLTTLPAVSGQISFQIFLPTQQPNPFWFGSLNFSISAPSRNINSAFIGHQEFTGLPLGQFDQITFTVPAAVVSALQGGTYNDLTFSFDLTVPAGSQTYLFDALNFVGVTAPVTVSPKRAAVTIGRAQSFSATVTGSSNTAVTWQVDGVTGGNTSIGAIDVNGNYTAPATAGTHTITAVSQADATKSASASIAITDLAGVLTYHNDLVRDGVNQREFALTTSTVLTNTFGKLFSCAVDGAVYTQPLWIPNLTVNGVKHNVVVAATEHDSLYAFDADANPCVTLWHSNLIDTSHGAGASEIPVLSCATQPNIGPACPAGTTSLVGSGFGDITPEVGVTGSPVIDPSTNTLYVVSKSVLSGTTASNAIDCADFFERLHALDLTTGAEKFGGPVAMDCSIGVPGTGDGSGDDTANGQVIFNPRNGNQRAALVLSNGIVYVTWSSHEDHTPYHGWVMGFNASTLARVPSAIYNTTPNGSEASIWMSGGAPAVDASGNLYFTTGNGTFDANNGGTDFGESLEKLSTSVGISVSDWFTPFDFNNLNGGDRDFGSGGVTILPDQTTGPVAHLIVGGGKDGNLFLWNRDNLGHFNASTNQVLQTINLGNEIRDTPAFWQNTLYVASGTQDGNSGPLQAFTFNTSSGLFNIPSSSQSSSPSAGFPFPAPTPSVSSLGTTNGLVWAIDASQYCTNQAPGCGPAVLHAYDATNLGTELWNSGQASGNRDQAGNAVKFAVPTVANGKVYIGTRTEVDVYGLLPN